MRILANISSLDAAPSVQFHERAPDAMDEDDLFADEDAVREGTRAAHKALNPKHLFSCFIRPRL